jgi:cardiolipin synthase A/B
MDWLDKLSRFWPHLVAGFDLLAALLASCHALLCKRDPRAATLWIGIIWLMPIIGPVLYLVFGVNRIRRLAIKLGVHQPVGRAVPENLGEAEHDGAEHLKMIARVVGRVVERPLTPGNTITPLVNGDEAFPAMLAAVESAKKSVSLVSYIFDNDPTGKQFVGALERAVKRGVEARVLIDAAGTRYSWPPITRILKRAQVPYGRFLPSSLLQPWRVATINLRNHRKVLVVDGQLGFTGGMNIRHGNVLASKPKSPVKDLHFRVEGPVVTRLQEAFVNDWAFTTGEVLDGDLWFPDLKESGSVIARVITDGPDADFDKLRWTLLAALAEAQTSIQIITPYFLPDTALITALNLAALRGVRVDIILPAKNNLPFVQWASRAMWWQVLQRGCHIWLAPPPFDHSKLMIVDGHWVFLGSANWDARSLRLNFELNVECYGRDFADKMELVLQKKMLGAHEVALDEVDARSVPGKLRDAFMRLFSPFL